MSSTSAKGWCGIHIDELLAWTVRGSESECWEAIRGVYCGKSKQFLMDTGWRVVRVTVTKD